MYVCVANFVYKVLRAFFYFAITGCSARGLCDTTAPSQFPISASPSMSPSMMHELAPSTSASPSSSSASQPELSQTASQTASQSAVSSSIGAASATQSASASVSSAASQSLQISLQEPDFHSHDLRLCPCAAWEAKNSTFQNYWCHYSDQVELLELSNDMINNDYESHEHDRCASCDNPNIDAAAVNPVCPSLRELGIGSSSGTGGNKTGGKSELGKDDNDNTLLYALIAASAFACFLLAALVRYREKQAVMTKEAEVGRKVLQSQAALALSTFSAGEYPIDADRTTHSSRELSRDHRDAKSINVECSDVESQLSKNPGKRKKKSKRSRGSVLSPRIKRSVLSPRTRGSVLSPKSKLSPRLSSLPLVIPRNHPEPQSRSGHTLIDRDAWLSIVSEEEELATADIPDVSVLSLNMPSTFVGGGAVE